MKTKLSRECEVLNHAACDSCVCYCHLSIREMTIHPSVSQQGYIKVNPVIEQKLDRILEILSDLPSKEINP